MPRMKMLLAVSVLTALLPPILVMAVNRGIDARYAGALKRVATAPVQPERPNECRPPVPASLLAAVSSIEPQEKDNEISSRMQEIFDEDQRVRKSILMFSPADPQTIALGDEERRIEVLGYLERGLVRAPADLVHAAFVFQHGDCPDHYLLANRLAGRAMAAGYEKAKWIYAATLDRWLMNTGRPQKYGTQYTFIEGRYGLYPVDPNTTDEERRQYDVPTLAEAKAAEGERRSGKVRMVSLLASTWLIVLGVGLSLSATVAAAFATQGNALWGKAVLVAALLLYVGGALGHWAEVAAFARATQASPVEEIPMTVDGSGNIPQEKLVPNQDPPGLRNVTQMP